MVMRSQITETHAHQPMWSVGFMVSLRLFLGPQTKDDPLTKQLVIELSKYRWRGTETFIKADRFVSAVNNGSLIDDFDSKWVLSGMIHKGALLFSEIVTLCKRTCPKQPCTHLHY